MRSKFGSAGMADKALGQDLENMIFITDGNASPPKLLDLGHMIIMSCCTVHSASDLEGTGQQRI